MSRSIRGAQNAASTRFVQSLIREVAYGTLAKRERRTRHLAAARYFEALGDDELAGLLASHYVAAHEASAEGGEADAVAIQARLALSGAADRAATLGGHEQAVSYLRQAIEITADASERAAQHLRAATSANAAALHDDAQVLVRAGLDLARSSADLEAVGACEALLGEVLIDSGQTAEAVEVLEAGVAAFPANGTGEVRATLLATLSRAYMRTGQPAKSVETADLALDLAEHLGLERLLAETLNNKGSSLGYMGRRREGQALLEAAVDVAHAGGFVAAEIRALSNSGASTEDPREGRIAYLAARDLALRVGNRNLARWAGEAARFNAWVIADGWDEILAESEDDRADDRGSPLDEARHAAIIAIFKSSRGEPTDAELATLDTVAAQVSDRYPPAAAHSLRGINAALRGDYGLAVDEALLATADEELAPYFLEDAMRATLWGRDLARAHEVADRLDAERSTGIQIATARLAARAGIAAIEGRIDEAILGYREAISRSRASGADFVVATISLDFVHLVGSDHPATRDAAAEARPIFERVRARPYLERLDAATARPVADASTTGADVTRAVSATPG